MKSMFAAALASAAIAFGLPSLAEAQTCATADLLAKGVDGTDTPDGTAPRWQFYVNTFVGTSSGPEPVWAKCDLFFDAAGNVVTPAMGLQSVCYDNAGSTVAVRAGAVAVDGNCQVDGQIKIRRRVSSGVFQYYKFYRLNGQISPDKGVIIGAGTLVETDSSWKAIPTSLSYPMTFNGVRGPDRYTLPAPSPATN